MSGTSTFVLHVASAAEGMRRGDAEVSSSVSVLRRAQAGGCPPTPSTWCVFSSRSLLLSTHKQHVSPPPGGTGEIPVKGHCVIKHAKLASWAARSYGGASHGISALAPLLLRMGPAFRTQADVLALQMMGLAPQ